MGPPTCPLDGAHPRAPMNGPRVMEGGNALLRTGMPVCPDTGYVAAWGAAAGWVVLRYLVIDPPSALWGRRLPFPGVTIPSLWAGTRDLLGSGGAGLPPTLPPGSRTGFHHRGPPTPHL